MKFIEKRSQTFILLVTILASGMAFLMSSSVNIALPTIRSVFDVELSVIQWVINGYIVTLSALMLLAGSLSDKFGTKKIFNIGVVVFGIASGLCGLAPDVITLIGFRGLQGVGAALMVPGSLSIINLCFVNKGRAIGLWAGWSGALAAVGPFIGGWLTETAGWRTVFLVFLPLALLTWWLSTKVVPELKGGKGSLNILSTILIICSFLLFSFGLIQAPGFGWSHPVIIGTLIGGVATLGFFVYRESRISNPLFPMKILKNKSVAGANLITLLIYFNLSVVFIFTNFRLQDYDGIAPTMAGLMMLPMPLVIALLSGLSGSFTDRHGPRLQMVIGPLILAVGLFLVRYPSLPLTIASFVIIGLGMVAIIPAITTAALEVKKGHSGAASGLNNTVARVSELFASGVVGSLLITFFALNIKGRGLTDEALILSQKSRLLDIQTQHGEFLRQAYLTAYQDALLIPVFLSLMSAGIAWFVFDQRQKPHS